MLTTGAMLLEATFPWAMFRPPVFYREFRPSNLELFYCSRRAERELGYRSRPLHVALEETISWCEQQGHLSPRTHQAPHP